MGEEYKGYYIRTFRKKKDYRTEWRAESNFGTAYGETEEDAIRDAENKIDVGLALKKMKELKEDPDFTKRTLGEKCSLEEVKN